jgi:hypothetical protein
MPRINPSPSSAQPIVPKPLPVARPAETTRTVAAAPTPPRELAEPSPRSLREQDDTPLLAEQQAFQLPASFVNDVQRIATKTGYVGLTANAIQRAYLQGDGLFVDISA